MAPPYRTEKRTWFPKFAIHISVDLVRGYIVENVFGNLPINESNYQGVTQNGLSLGTKRNTNKNSNALLRSTTMPISSTRRAPITAADL